MGYENKYYIVICKYGYDNEVWCFGVPYSDRTQFKDKTLACIVLLLQNQSYPFLSQVNINTVNINRRHFTKMILNNYLKDGSKLLNKMEIASLICIKYMTLFLMFKLPKSDVRMKTVIVQLFEDSVLRQIR